jgi:hypothetical protein
VTVTALAHAQSGGHDLWATLVVIVVLLAMPVLSIWFLWRQEDDGSDDAGDDGGPGGGPPPEPPPAPDGPAWWPEFERDFATYVAASAGAPPEAPPSHDRPNYTLGQRGNTR